MDEILKELIIATDAYNEKFEVVKIEESIASPELKRYWAAYDKAKEALNMDNVFSTIIKKT